MMQDMRLNFSPDIPDDMAAIVMEGFEGLQRVEVRDAPRRRPRPIVRRWLIPTLCQHGRRVTWIGPQGIVSVDICQVASAGMWDFDGLFELVIGSTRDDFRGYMWQSPLATGSEDDELERFFQESCARIIAAVSAANKKRCSTHEGADRRCVTGPPDHFPMTDLWKISHIESRGHIWGTETSIDAPDVLAAGSVVASGHFRRSITMPKVVSRPGREKSRDGDRRQPGGIQ